jgi:diaminopimelate decarboxylase
MKANSNLSVMRTLANRGSGFDVVSAGELQRVIAAGGDPKKCVFAGVAKSEKEIELALLQGIYSFNCESEPEILRINKVAARLKKRAPIAVRINPNVAAKTHYEITTGTYENKFGIAFEQVPGVYARASELKNIRLRGVPDAHRLAAHGRDALRSRREKVLPLVRELTEKYSWNFSAPAAASASFTIRRSPVARANGGQSKSAKGILTPAVYAEKLLPLLKPLGLKILIEPGRFIVGNAGALVTQVEYVKRTGKKNFVIVDAAMNDLIRPAFYDSYHEIVPLVKKSGATVSSDVVGGICESGDYFCKDRPLAKVGEGDRLALLSAGAYGFVMASTSTRARWRRKFWSAAKSSPSPANAKK